MVELEEAIASLGQSLGEAAGTLGRVQVALLKIVDTVQRVPIIGGLIGEGSFFRFERGLFPHPVWAWGRAGRPVAAALCLALCVGQAREPARALCMALPSAGMSVRRCQYVGPKRLP